MAQPTILDTAVDIESSKLAPAVSVGVDRKQLYFLSRGSSTGDVTMPSAITIGGVTPTFEGGSAYSAISTGTGMFCVSMNESQLASMVGNTVVITSDYFNGRQIIQVLSFQNMSQIANATSGYWSSGGTSVTGGAASLVRRANSMTVAVAQVIQISSAVMTNPSKVTDHSSPSTRASLGYSADTARTIDASYTCGSTKNAILAMNFIGVPAFTITSTNDGNNTLNANTVNTAPVVGFAPTSGTVGNLTLTNVSTTNNITSFTIPWMNDGEIYPAFGINQTLTLSDGTNSATFEAMFNTDSDYSVATLSSPDNLDTHKLGFYFSAAGQIPVTGDTVTSITTDLVVNPDTSVTAPVVPVSTVLYHRVNSSGVVYSHTVNASVEGEIGTGTPDQPTIASATNVEPSTAIISAPFEVTGVSVGEDVSIGNGVISYSVDTGSGYGAATTIASTVNLGDFVRIHGNSSSTYGGVVSFVLPFGNTTASFTINTRAADIVPGAFTLTDVTNAEPATSTESNTIIITETDSGVNIPISITAGFEYKINNGSYVSGNGNVVLGDEVTVRVASSSSFNTAVTGTLNIGGVTDTFSVTTRVADILPDAFTFIDSTDAGWGVWAVSNTVTLVGADNNVNLTITATGSEYSIYRAGSWTAYTGTTGTIQNGEQLRIRVQTSNNSATQTSGSVAISGVSGTFNVTTGTIDLTPDIFSFTTITNAGLNSQVESNSITISGVTAATNIPVIATNVEYSINTGGGWSAFTSSNGNIQNGHQLKVRLTTSSDYNTEALGSISIGGLSADFSVTTETVDIVPDAFSFDAVNTSVFGAQVVCSNTVVLSGVTPATNIPITTTNGLLYSISVDGTNWSAFTGSTGNIQNGNLLRVSILSSILDNTGSSGNITIGGISATFTVTTGVADRTPNSNTFTPVSSASVSTLYTSNTVTISGLTENVLVSITINNNTYSIYRDGGWEAWTSSAGTVKNGDQVRIQTTSSSTPATNVTSTITVGGVTSTFTVSTIALDLIPDVFVIPTITNANLNATLESESVTISGVTPNQNVPISIAGNNALYSVYANGVWSAFSSVAGNIQNGQSFKVMMVSSTAPETNVVSTINIGGVNSSFIISTIVADTTPDAFSFVQLTGVNLNTTAVSNSISVSGLTPGISSPISVTGMLYSVYTLGSWTVPTATSGTVVNGDFVRVHLTTSTQYNTSTSGQLVIGGVSSTFVSTTKILDISPNPLTFPTVNGAELSINVESQAIVVSGLTPNVDITVSITNGEYSINNGSSWSTFTSNAGIIRNGYSIKLRLTSADTELNSTISTITIGDGVGTFTVNTRDVIDLIPNDFIINTVLLVDVASSVESPPVGITGMTPGYESVISANNLVFSVYHNGVWSPFSRAPRTIRNGDYFKVNLIASPLHDAFKVGAITIGGVTRTYTVRTVPITKKAPAVKHDRLS